MGNPATQAEELPELIELIQFYALRRDALKLTVESETLQRGWVSVDEGDVVRVDTAGGKAGIDAFVEIVSWDQPRVVGLERNPIFDANIDVPIAELLMETFWQAQEHIPTDPTQDPLPSTLEEETVAVAPQDFRPPDGLTKSVLANAQRYSDLQGFVAVALYASDTGECIEVLGHRSGFEVPRWLPEIVIEQAEDPDTEHAMFIDDDFIDVLIAPLADENVSYFLRMATHRTNRGLLEAALRRPKD